MCCGLVRADETRLVMCINMSTCTCTCAFTRLRRRLRTPTPTRALPILRTRDRDSPSLLLFPRSFRPLVVRLHLIDALHVLMHCIQIQREARKRRRGIELIASPRTSGVRREEAADADERAQRVLRHVRRRGLEIARGRREGKRGRALRGAAPSRCTRRRGWNYDAGLEERDVSPGGAAGSWGGRDGPEEEDE